MRKGDMKGTFVYIFGVPGSGKSTLMAELTRGHRAIQSDYPIPHIWYGDGKVMELGKRRAQFSGTDALALNVQPKAAEWVEQHPASLILAEGDRLANDKFFQHIVDSGYDFQAVWVDTEAGEAARRRTARGSDQNATWLKGRRSKVEGLVSRWGHWRLPGELDPAAQANLLQEWIPALKEMHDAAVA